MGWRIAAIEASAKSALSSAAILGDKRLEDAGGIGGDGKDHGDISRRNFGVGLDAKLLKHGQDAVGVVKLAQPFHFSGGVDCGRGCGTSAANRILGWWRDFRHVLRIAEKA